MSTNPNPNAAKNPNFGDLNDVSKPGIRKRFNLNHGQTMGAIASATRDTFIPDGLANVGEFKGVVLQIVTGPMANDTTQEKGGWFSSFYENESEIAEYGSLIEIKVRVPEVHSMLPIPDQIGQEVPPEQQAIIDMYPTYVAQSTAVQEPKPGDLVWVDWGNRQNWTDPYYIRPVKEVGVGAGQGGNRGRGAHIDCSGGAYRTAPPSGDSKAGANAKVPPHTGLPRLKRVQKPTGKPTLITDKNFTSAGSEDKIAPVAVSENYPVLPRVKKAVENILPPGKAFFGPIHGNGVNIEHKQFKEIISRGNLIWFSNATDFKQPWELIYFFHNAGAWHSSFLREQAKQISSAVTQGRNFVVVLPQLPWATQFWSSGSTYGQVFNKKKDKEDFNKYHKKVLGAIAKLAGRSAKDTSPSYISVHAHGAGGLALKQVSMSGALDGLKVNRIFLGNVERQGDSKALKEVWNRYVSKQPNVWLTVMNSQGGSGTRSDTEAEAIFGKLTDAQRKLNFYWRRGSKHKKGYQWIQNNSLITVSDEFIERQKQKDKKDKEEADKAKPNDDEGQENKVQEEVAQEAKEAAPGGKEEDKEKKTAAEEVPKKDATGENPPSQKPATSASKVDKKSNTAKSPDFKTAPAVAYQENRVKTKEYGGSLVGAAASKLLEEVEPGVKLHKLVAARYRAIKKAAIAAGFDKFKISSGWRRHRWKSREHYNQTMIKKYGSVAKGRAWMAYESPHETGMAMDVKAHGVYASKGGSKTAGTQKKTPLFAWLKENAHKFGFTPYKKEPWHWECRLPYDAYATGKDFTKDYAVRVTYIGGKNAQLPTGPSTGGSASGNSSGGGGGRCVRTGRGGGYGGGPPGPYTPGKPFPVTGGGSLGKKLKPGPPPSDAEFWGQPDRNMKELKLFVLHETAGWPNAYQRTYNGLARKKGMTTKKGNWMPAHERCVTFWGTVEGDVIQTARPEQIVWHANCTNPWSTGTEVCGFANAKADYACHWEKRLALGMHQVSHNGKGDIPTEPGKFVASSPTGKNAQQLSTLEQCESAWQLILWLSKNPPKVDPKYKWKKGGQSGTPKINIPISFPCGIEGDKFWWTKWAGRPVKDKKPAGAWFEKHQPAGIVSHARIWCHHDGLPLEYYCYARAAKGMKPKDAYYAMVGALSYGERVRGVGCWTPLPNSQMISLGKKKFKSAWFGQKTQKMVGKKKWKELAAANPQWFANPRHQEMAKTGKYK